MTAWLKTVLLTIKNAIVSRDTFLIFAIASLFYLVFYALPYDNQIIVRIPTAIVDMDQTERSHDFVNKILSAQTVDARLITANYNQAQEQFARNEVDVIVVIGQEFSRDLARGEPVAVHVFSNGAMPVKGRAVSSSLLTIVAEENTVEVVTRLLHKGLNPTVAKSMTQAAPSMVSQDLFNNIGGYGYYTVPLVAVVIVQAVMFFGIGIALGQWLEANPRPGFITEAFRTKTGLMAVYSGFVLIAFFWGLFLETFGLAVLGMPTFLNAVATLAALAAFSLSVCALAMLLTFLMGTYRYAPALVLASAPSVFLCGLVFPMENFATWVIPFAWMIPTTPACQALVFASQEGSNLSQVTHLIAASLLQFAVYGSLMLFVFSRRYLAPTTNRSAVKTIEDGY